MSGHVLVVGSANVDLVLHCPRLPVAGETLAASHFRTAPGGKGANQAVAAARLGADTKFVACIGADSHGQQARRALVRAGVDTRWLTVAERAPTGTAVVLVDDEGENMIVVSAGANDGLSAREVVSAEAAWRGAALAVCQLEVPIAAVQAAIHQSASQRVPVLLNAAPALPLPRGLLQHVEWLVANQVEMAALAGAPVTSPADALQAALALRKHGPRSVLVTLGNEGVALSSSDHHGLLPAEQVRAVDTTGAGDTFVGALSAALARGWPMLRSVEFAQRAAAWSVARAGTQESMPTLDDLGVGVAET